MRRSITNHLPTLCHKYWLPSLMKHHLHLECIPSAMLEKLTTKTWQIYIQVSIWMSSVLATVSRSSYSPILCKSILKRMFALKSAHFQILCWDTLWTWDNTQSVIWCSMASNFQSAAMILASSTMKAWIWTTALAPLLGSWTFATWKNWALMELSTQASVRRRKHIWQMKFSQASGKNSSNMWIHFNCL